LQRLPHVFKSGFAKAFPVVGKSVFPGAVELDDFHIRQAVDFCRFPDLVIALPDTPLFPFDLLEGQGKYRSGKKFILKGG
jgi:hypothetical protein